jgi:hypothetical protein
MRQHEERGAYQVEKMGLVDEKVWVCKFDKTK